MKIIYILKIIYKVIVYYYFINMRIGIDIDVDTLFLKHPREKNMTYLEHFTHAIKYSGKLLYGSAVLFVHAIIPYYFEKTGSTIIREINEELNKDD